MTKIEAALSGYIACLDDNEFDYFTNEEKEIVKCAVYLVEGIKRFYDKNQVVVVNDDPYQYEYDVYDLEVSYRTDMNRIRKIINDKKVFGFDSVYCFDKINGVKDDIKLWNFILSLARQNDLF